MALLEVDGIVVRYGQAEAVRGLTLSIDSGRTVALLGPNGAGKTTLVKTIAGLLRPDSGQIRYEDERIDSVAPHTIASRGITTVPEGRELFPQMTVEENLEMGAFQRRGIRTSQAGRLRNRSREIQRIFEYFPAIARRRKQVAGTLSGGEQQMLAIGRALMARPRLVLLDEPSLGLAPRIIGEIFRIIERIQREGVTILLVEQNVTLAASVADYAYVIGNGSLTAEGSIQEMQAEGKLAASYLGAAERDRGGSQSV